MYDEARIEFHPLGVVAVIMDAVGVKGGGGEAEQHDRIGTDRLAPIGLDVAGRGRNLLHGRTLGRLAINKGLGLREAQLAILEKQPLEFNEGQPARSPDFLLNGDNPVLNLCWRVDQEVADQTHGCAGKHTTRQAKLG